MSKARRGSTQPGAADGLQPGKPSFLAVGKLLHTHGIHGEMLMELYTDFPERIVPGILLHLDPPGSSLRLAKRRPHKGGLLVTFEGYTTPEAIGQFRNQVLYVPADGRPPLEDGAYYQHQLLNLHVRTDEGAPLGTVDEILETGASQVLVVHPEFGPDVLIPFVSSFIRKVDLDQNEIIVHLIPGMLEEKA